MKKLITLALISILLIAALPSCGAIKGPISDDEAKDILTSLLPDVTVLNSVLWGEVDTLEKVREEDAAARTCTYYRVAAGNKYHSVEALRADVEKYYSEELAAIISAYAFENSDLGMSRFCDYRDGSGTVTDLQVDVTSHHEPYTLTAVALLDSVRVVRSTEYILECEITVESGKNATERSVTLKLLKEDGAWKFDSYNWLIGYR